MLPWSEVQRNTEVTPLGPAGAPTSETLLLERIGCQRPTAAGSGDTRQHPKAQVRGTIRNCLTRADAASKRLITRRSRVQIPPGGAVSRSTHSRGPHVSRDIPDGCRVTSRTTQTVLPRPDCEVPPWFAAHVHAVFTVLERPAHQYSPHCSDGDGGGRRRSHGHERPSGPTHDDRAGGHPAACPVVQLGAGTQPDRRRPVLEERWVDPGVSVIERGALEDWMYRRRRWAPPRPHRRPDAERGGAGDVVGELAVLAPAPPRRRSPPSSPHCCSAFVAPLRRAARRAPGGVARGDLDIGAPVAGGRG